MKKLFSLTAAVIFLVFGVKSSFGQSGCVSCNNNVIDTLNFSSAIGTDNTATGNRSFAGGIYSEANGSASFAFGNRAIAEGATSAVIGQFARVYTSTAMVFGAGFDIDNPLINSEYYSLMIGFGSTKSTLFVGPSVGVNNTGKIGIGNVTEPQAKLHIRADENEHATLRLEATGSDKHSRLYFSDDIYLTASPQNNLSFTLPENNNLIFEYGNVGIGTNDPQAMLHVNGSMIVGDNNTASESYSFAGGSNTQATGENSFAFGEGAIASGINSLALGKEAEANGMYSTAIGRESIVNGDGSFAFGLSNIAQAGSSYLIGELLKSMASGSITLGNGATTSQPLVNNWTNSLMIGFKSIYPTLFVQGQSSVNNDKTGRVGIGKVTDPQAKLHIRADANEHATLRLEATGSDKHSRINFTDAHQILASANDHMHFHTAEGKDYIFHDGDIYLSDIQSGIIMKSPNGQCWRGVLSDNGQLVFSVVTCPDGSANVPEPSIEPALQMKIYPNPTDGTITIEVPDGVTNAGWSLRSTDGALLMRNRITSGKTEISLAHFVAGVYVIGIEQNGRLIASEKVVKQ